VGRLPSAITLDGKYGAPAGILEKV
jgi:hypothetical protein